MMRAEPRGGRLDEEELLVRLRAGGPAVVALSGGVDSAVVALLAFRALGPAARAVTLVGPAVASEEVTRARAVAARIGIAHTLLPVDPLRTDGYRTNPTNRCYFCRKTEMGAIRRWAEGQGVRQFLDGVQADDLAEDRPGLQAMAEEGFRHPLLEAGWRKADVRELARTAGLPNHDTPSESCLASRIAHGVAISPEVLRRVEQAERLVRAQGFVRVRVRTDGRSARVEVDPSEVARLTDPPRAERIQRELAALGFAEVRMDPKGYHAGGSA